LFVVILITGLLGALICSKSKHQPALMVAIKIRHLLISLFTFNRHLAVGSAACAVALYREMGSDEQ
jgi:hypothetical protein